MVQVIKTTVLGGLVFLIPFVILFIVFVKAHQLISALAAPLLSHMPTDNVLGVATVNIAIATIGFLICFLAGLASKSPTGDRLVASLESTIVSKFPAYRVEKLKLSNEMRIGQKEDTQFVIVRFDDQWQLGFLVGSMAGGYAVVYLPGAPDPWSGAITIVSEDRITPMEGLELDANMDIFRNLGRGADNKLQKYMQKG